MLCCETIHGSHNPQEDTQRAVKRQLWDRTENFSMENPPFLSSPLEILSPEDSQRILMLSALLATMPRQDGNRRQGLLARAPRFFPDTWSAARDWLEEEIQCSISGKQLRRAENFMRDWQPQGFWVAEFTSPCEHQENMGACPRFLFGQGQYPRDTPLAAFFNSRKSRNLSPEAFWIQALRGFLEKWPVNGQALASSLGTLTHDLVTHVGLSRSIATILVVHSSFDRLESVPRIHGFSKSFRPLATLTCQAPAMVCARKDLMLCRDRILAKLAHEHCLVELRPEGNLHRMLRELHADGSRSVRFATRVHEGQRASTHHGTAHSISKGAVPLILEVAKEPSGVPPAKARPIGDPSHLFSPPEPWNRYLYHYTRSCWGPWPGQSYEDYLESLYQGRKDSGHTTLDTLVRILREKRLRASSKTIRGTTPVISWTVHAPSKLPQIRHWNRALVRWTFEPYGIAVLKRRLKALGAKPTIYAPAGAFPRLRQCDRHRFQRHEPPDICWRQEREHRLPGDLKLDALENDDYFIFVPKGTDALFVKGHSLYLGPVVITHENQGTKGTK